MSSGNTLSRDPSSGTTPGERAGAFVDGEFPAGPGGRDGDRRAGLLVAAAERGLAAGRCCNRGLSAGRGEDAAADRAGGRPVVVPRRDLGCGVRGFHGLRLRSPGGCRGGQVSGVTPWPAMAWDRRTDSPEVWQTWAWCRSRSTVAVASVLGISSSKPAGCRFEEIATDRFSYAASTSR